MLLYIFPDSFSKIFFNSLFFSEICTIRSKRVAPSFKSSFKLSSEKSLRRPNTSTLTFKFFPRSCYSFNLCNICNQDPFQIPIFRRNIFFRSKLKVFRLVILQFSLCTLLLQALQLIR